MVGRLIFALIGVAIFLSSLLAGWAEWWALPISFLLIGGIAFVAYISTGFGRDVEAAEMISDLLLPFMGTNNRWWVCLLVMTILSWIVLIAGGFGPPTLLESVNPGSVDFSEYTSWPALWTRLFASVSLTSMLIGYSFFAPADEIARTARGLRTRVVGGTEVSVGSSLPSRLMRLWSQRRRQATVLAPTVPGTPQAPPQGDGQGRLRQELGVELGVSAGVKLAEMAWEEFRRRSRR